MAESPATGHIPVVYLDALFVKVRHEGRVVKKTVYLALGINLDVFLKPGTNRLPASGVRPRHFSASGAGAVLSPYEHSLSRYNACWRTHKKISATLSGTAK